MDDRYQDRSYLAQNPTWHAEDSPWKARQVFGMMQRHRLRPATVCEVGCGAGEILVQLSRLLAGEVTFHGYELSPQAFALCLQRPNERVHFHQEDFLAYAGPAYDLLLVIDVVEHVEDYLGFLRALRPKGVYKILHLPLDLSVSSVLRVGALQAARRSVGHLHYFTAETALATLREAGYEIIDHCFTAGSLELEPRSRRARLARWPRRLVAAVSRPLAARLLGGFSLLVLAR